jgi:hypothetical protein
MNQCMDILQKVEVHLCETSVEAKTGSLSWKIQSLRSLGLLLPLPTNLLEPVPLLFFKWPQNIL